MVIEYAEDQENEDAEPNLYVVVNPEIIETNQETVPGVEGCLSVPRLVGEVERFTELTVRGQNRRGQPIKIKATGWLARIFQHEIDHLEGVIFTDRATRIWQPKEGDPVPRD